MIKTPKPGFELGPEHAVTVAKDLKGIVPESHFELRNGKPVLIQRFVEGRKATEEELPPLREQIRKRGWIARGLLPQDVIVTAEGEKWVVDVGAFERAA